MQRMRGLLVFNETPNTPSLLCVMSSRSTQWPQARKRYTPYTLCFRNHSTNNGKKKAPGEEIWSPVSPCYICIFEFSTKNRNKKKHGTHKEKGKYVRSHTRRYVVNTKHGWESLEAGLHRDITSGSMCKKKTRNSVHNVFLIVKNISPENQDKHIL